MSKIDLILLKCKFRGCLMGSLVGDCLGAPFEGESMTRGNRLVLHNYFDKLSGPYFKEPYKEYTDDTAMTKCLAKSLIEKPELDIKHIAQMFVKEYFSEPKRGYGQNVVDVFHKLRNNRFSDIYKPAKQQFEGRGSYGNGGAMRIAPIALLFHDDYDAMINAARKVTEITHTNHLGIQGALLQCMALQQSLLLNPKDQLDVMNFVKSLKSKIEPIEKESNYDDLEVQDFPYQRKLDFVMKFLKEEPSDELDERVIDVLGNDISALHSVPTAIYCFLRSFSEHFKNKESESFRNTIEYATSLGGDTDTIASMAGGLFGAYSGIESINESLIKHCEYHNEIIQIADELYSAVTEETKRVRV